MSRLGIVSLIAATGTAACVVGFLASTSRTQKDSQARLSKGLLGAWTVFTASPPGKFRHLQFLREDQGWAVTDHALWRTDDGGQSWREVRIAPAVQILAHQKTPLILERVQFLDEREGWVQEGDYLLHTTDGGTAWRKHEFKDVIVRAFRFVDNKNGWFVGQQIVRQSNPSTVESWHPVVYSTDDSGASWSRQYRGSTDRVPFWDTWPMSSKSVWVVGAEILFTSDGGTTWKKTQIEDTTGLHGTPVKIQFTDPSTGWIITNQPGDFLFTSDGGNTWQLRKGPENGVGFSDMVYVSPTEAWGVERNIYHSTDSGKSWTKALDGDFFRIHFLKEQNMVLAAGKAIARYKSP